MFVDQHEVIKDKIENSKFQHETKQHPPSTAVFYAETENVSKYALNELADF